MADGDFDRIVDVFAVKFNRISVGVAHNAVHGRGAPAVTGYGSGVAGAVAGVFADVA